MFNSEIDVLQILENNEEISQREIAKLSGFSLGKVNILIKKFVKKGFVKIDKLNSKKLRYILTPKGMSQLTKKSLNYIRRSYRAVNILVSKLKKLSLKKKFEQKNIRLYGYKDEVYEITITTLDDLNVDYQNIHNIDKTNFSPDEEFIVIYWNSDYVEKINESKEYNENVEFINILTL